MRIIKYVLYWICTCYVIINYAISMIHLVPYLLDIFQCPVSDVRCPLTSVRWPVSTLLHCPLHIRISPGHMWNDNHICYIRICPQSDLDNNIDKIVVYSLHRCWIASSMLIASLLYKCLGVPISSGRLVVC